VRALSEVKAAPFSSPGWGGSPAGRLQPPSPTIFALEIAAVVAASPRLFLPGAWWADIPASWYTSPSWLDQAAPIRSKRAPR
jgi:hypothetical protein